MVDEELLKIKMTQNATTIEQNRLLAIERLKKAPEKRQEKL